MKTNSWYVISSLSYKPYIYERNSIPFLIHENPGSSINVKSYIVIHYMNFQYSFLIHVINYKDFLPIYVMNYQHLFPVHLMKYQNSFTIHVMNY